MRKAMSLALLLLVAMFCNAQMADPVKFKSHLKTGSTAEAEIVFDGKIAHGWHVYSTNLGSDGPIEASFHVDKKDGVELVGKLTPRGHEISMMDNMFGMKLRFFENSVQFVQKVKFTKPTYTLKAYLEYGACNDEMCMPPTQVNAHFSGKSPAIDGKAAADEKSADDVAETLKAGGLDSSMVKAGAVDSVAVADSAAAPQLDNAEVQKLWTPVIKELAKFDKPVSNSLLYIFLAGLVGGFLALFTPCVWPIIPMTVSFFLKRNKDRKKAIREAITYGVSIVVIYVALGLIVSLLFGASALNALSTNAIFNILFCLLLVVFAASFFGAFEITLPSSWSNKIDQKSDETSGVLSIFLMAFTLSLVSFSCTGPIIGFLLVAVASEGSIVAPTIGMLGFAVALAIPFALFAMFPTLLKSAPKSGGWMNVLKVVLGFIELAFALKFLSVADLAYGWHILDRETFLALWIAIFSLLGLYLLGIFNFPHDDENRRTNVPQFFLALGSLAFAFYMIPGLWGAPLKAVSAFAPPMNTQDFNLYKNEVHPRFKDFEAGMAAARLEGKPVMIDFTGFGCVNCRKMEAAVWTDAKVADMLNNKYVLISLYVDDKTPLPEQITVTDTDGTQRPSSPLFPAANIQRPPFILSPPPFLVKYLTASVTDLSSSSGIPIPHEHWAMLAPRSAA
jgi:thiol:disulfide interchange protein